MPGAHSQSSNSYLPIMLALGDDVSWVHSQLYNAPSIKYGEEFYLAGTKNFVIAQTLNLIEGWENPGFAGSPGYTFSGLKPSQIVLGVAASAHAAGGFIPHSEIKEAIACLRFGQFCGSLVPSQTYPEIRGFMTWSVSYDSFQDYSLLNALNDCIKTEICSP